MPHYTFAWQEQSSLMIGMGHHLACQRHVSSLFPMIMPEHLVYWKDGQTHAYFSEKSIEHWKETGKKFLEKEYVRLFLDETKKLRLSFFNAIGDITHCNLKKMSPHALNHLMMNYYHAVIAIQGIYLATQPEGVFHVDLELKKKLEELELEDKEQTHSILITPTELDLTQQEIVDWFQAINRENLDNTDFMHHASQYPCFFFNSYSHTSILSYLKQRYDNEDKKELMLTISELFNKKKEVYIKKNQLLATLPSDIAFLSETLSMLALDRFKLKNCWSGAELLALPLFEEIARRGNINKKELISYYSAEEITNLLINNVLVPSDEIIKRKEHMIYHVCHGEGMLYSGKNAKEKISSLFDYTPLYGADMVKGMVANSGTISGRVQVVLVEDLEHFMKHAEQFQQGDILVTTMTSPNMVPLIKKAAGIVTNEGGICSHAAVISREITTPRKKPCIVGTHDATRIFKSGDYIILDGKQGHARKICREEHEKMIAFLERALEE